MPTRVNLQQGDRFGFLIVIDPDVKTEHSRERHCRVQCDCGKVKLVRVAYLPSGHTRSCGTCSRLKPIGTTLRGPDGKVPRLYTTWLNMHTRCNNPRNNTYRYYGARGINVCDDWNTSYPAFRDWALSHGYEPGLELDRIDVDANYTPDNCQFVTRTRQMNNTRRSRLLQAFNETKTLADWSRDPRCVVGYSTVRDRLTTGWSVERALTQPKLKE